MTAEWSRNKSGWDAGADVPFNASLLSLWTREDTLPISFPFLSCFLSSFIPHIHLRSLIFSPPLLPSSSATPLLVLLPTLLLFLHMTLYSLFFPFLSLCLFFSPTNPHNLLPSSHPAPKPQPLPLPLGDEATAECRGASDHSSVNHNWGWHVAGWDPLYRKSLAGLPAIRAGAFLVFSFPPSSLSVFVSVSEWVCIACPRNVEEMFGAQWAVKGWTYLDCWVWEDKTGKYRQAHTGTMMYRWSFVLSFNYIEYKETVHFFIFNIIYFYSSISGSSLSCRRKTSQYFQFVEGQEVIRVSESRQMNRQTGIQHYRTSTESSVWFSMLFPLNY